MSVTQRQYDPLLFPSIVLVLCVRVGLQLGTSMSARVKQLTCGVKHISCGIRREVATLNTLCVGMSQSGIGPYTTSIMQRNLF